MGRGVDREKKAWRKPGPEVEQGHVHPTASEGAAPPPHGPFSFLPIHTRPASGTQRCSPGAPRETPSHGSQGSAQTLVELLPSLALACSGPPPHRPPHPGQYRLSPRTLRPQTSFVGSNDLHMGFDMAAIGCWSHCQLPAALTFWTTEHIPDDGRGRGWGPGGFAGGAQKLFLLVGVRSSGP